MDLYWFFYEIFHKNKIEAEKLDNGMLRAFLCLHLGYLWADKVLEIFPEYTSSVVKGIVHSQQFSLQKHWGWKKGIKLIILLQKKSNCSIMNTYKRRENFRTWTTDKDR